MTLLLKVFYRFNGIPVKISKAIFAVKKKKNHTKIRRESQGTPNSQNTLEKEDGHHFQISKHITK